MVLSHFLEQRDRLGVLPGPPQEASMGENGLGFERIGSEVLDRDTSRDLYPQIVDSRVLQGPCIQVKEERIVRGAKARLGEVGEIPGSAAPPLRGPKRGWPGWWRFGLTQ